MSESFGQMLRRRREEQQITIDAIAAQTKINPTLLHGLERDDLSQWPEGIFRRAYIRAYAAAIGLDPDTTAREFLARYPDSVVVLPAGAAVWPDQTEREAPLAGRRLGRLVSALASVPARLRRLESNNGNNGGGNGRPFASAERDPDLDPGLDLDELDEGVLFVRRGTDISSAEEADEVEAPLDRETDTAPDIDLDQIEVEAKASPDDQIDLDLDLELEASSGAEAPAAEPVAPAPERVEPPVPRRAPVADPAAVAQVCTRLAQAEDADAVGAVMADAAALLDAVGLIVWATRPGSALLEPAIVHGYSPTVRARLRAIRCDAENAVGLAYRRREMSIVEGDGSTGAIAAPLLGPRGCAGVLALELPAGAERDCTVQAFAAILAAQLVSAPLASGAALAPGDVSAVG